MRKNSQITDLPKINFRAYGGDDPFIFVSYSHRDDELVYPELKRLRSLGFNIWYDEGLGAGNVWADELARRLRKCALTIYFISPNSVLSRFCANEVCYALEIEKPVLLVHLRPAILSPGLHMQLGSIQGILKYQLSESLYAEKLKESLDRLMGDGDGGAGALVAAEVERELPNLPLGVVTLFRVEISESQDLANALGDRYADVVVRLRHLMRDVISRYSGIEIESSGDTHFSAFRDARNGVHAAIGAQYACAAEKWPTEGAVNLRMGLHTGQPSLIENTYIGVDVHRALQIAAVGSGGQILMSSTTRTFLSDDDFPQGTVVRDLGLHRLQNMPYPEALYDLAISGLNDKFEHVASITNRPTNLPTALTNFVGRNRELTQICKTLMLADTRILTLTGPGGTGKTRLAIEAASRLAKHFPDGVFIVRLSAITDPTLVIFTIAETLGVTEFPGQTQTESLINHLANRRMLLVMDNFEHIVEGATALLDLLHDCSGVKVIVTSREPLNLRPEREFSVMPLQLPHPAPAHQGCPLEEVESVQLFMERVKDFKPDFSLNTENEAAITAICIKLDGLPLALELAAARLNIFTPQALLENLGRSLEVLKSRSRDLPDRQRTLRTTVQWSYDLLNTEEQFLFRRLSVFTGGFSISTARVFFAEEHDNITLLDGIESLVKKSLLNPDTAQLEPRFWMLETIREYGLGQLRECGEFEAVREKHAEHYLNLAESQAPGLIGHENRHCVSKLLIDADNLRATMGWAIEHGNANITTRMFKALLWLWIPRGYFTEGKEWVERAMERFQDLEASREKALIYETAGYLDAIGGDYLAAAPNLEICLDIFAETGDAADVARNQLALGLTWAVLEVPGGPELSAAALATFRELDDEYYLALSMLSVGITHLANGDIPRTAEHWQDALEIFRKIGSSYWNGQMLINLAHILMKEGDWQGTNKLLTEALEIAREFHYPMIITLSVAVMGGVAALCGKCVEAAGMFGSVQASLTRLGVTLEPLDQVYLNAYMAEAKKQLPEKTFKEAFLEGMQWNELETFAIFREVSECGKD